MLCYARPQEPIHFARQVEKPQQAIAAIIARGEHPRSEQFTAKWQQFKQIFCDTQHGKCGYCEHDTWTSYHGDVEHFAPKAGIDELHPSLQGPTMPAQAGDTPPHPAQRVCERGYWWLAYAWHNYLFACARCNQVHKRNIFPVDPRQNPREPAFDVEETPLLLNPYEQGLNPADHIRFSDQGEIYDRSVRGWETIRTCRLDRIALTTARRDKARRAHWLARKLLTAVERPSLLEEAIRELRELGDETRPFAGMVRIIFEHETHIAWSDAMAAWPGQS